MNPLLGVDAEQLVAAGARVLDEIEDLDRDVELTAVRRVDRLNAWAGLSPARHGFDTIRFGDGSPVVSEVALLELAAHLHLSFEAAHLQVGRALDLMHRFPKIWARVVAGNVRVWQAMTVVEKTGALTLEAAAFVDANVAPFLGGCTWAQVERTIEQALIRLQPEEAERRAKEAAEARFVHIGLDKPRDGMVDVFGVLDYGDAADLESAVATRAEDIAGCGSTASRDVRRSMALGEIARRDAVLPLFTMTESPTNAGAAVHGLHNAGGRGDCEADHTDSEFAAPERGSGPRGRREVVLYAHLPATAFTGQPGAIGWAEHNPLPVLAEQVRRWINEPTMADSQVKVSIRPVLNLAADWTVDRYVPPERMREQVELRDRRCVFPNCHRPARSRYGKHLDGDHICAYCHRDPCQGGPTCPDNLAPLCRRHHRAKTFAGWRYEPTVLPDGGRGYSWTSPGGRTLVVDPRDPAHLTVLDLDWCRPGDRLRVVIGAAGPPE